MEISRTTIEHIANLSRLNISNEEADSYQAQLNSILHFIDKLNELDTSQIEPTSHPLDLSNVLRADVVQESLAREEALRNAPSAKDDQFRVPAAIEG